jgi:hypothetical protein
VATRWWSDDGQLLAALDDAVRSAGEVPPGFVDAGRACFVWHDLLDAQIAPLCYDSTVDARECLMALTRSTRAELRALTFASARLSVHVEVVRDSLHGQFVPPQAGEIELCCLDGSGHTAPVDEVGWFVVRPVPAGAIRLRFRTVDGSTVLTDWFTL